MANKSTTDAAYEIMSSKKRAMQFNKLWQDVAKATGANKDEVAEFYSDLTLDSRFARLKDGRWDLKSRRKFSESHVDLKKIELDDDTSNGDYLKDEDEESSNEDDN